MRKKFTYLISLAVAMICSSGGVAWGQTYWSTGTASAEVWTCYPPTSNATCGEGVLIDGHNYYAYIGSIQGWGGTLTPTPSHSGYTTSSADPETYAAVSYSTSYNSTTGTITITRKTITHHYASHSCGVSCTEYSHTYSFSLDYKYIDVSSSGVSGHYVYPDVSHLNPYNSTTHAYDLNWTAHPGAHVATHAPINVTLTKVQSTLSFKDPHYHHYHYNWTWDSGWSSKIEESPAENAYVVNNKMTISDSEGLRLTGSGGSSEIDQVKDNDGNNSSNNEASYLNFGTSNHKLYFDEDWKGGTANGSAGAWLLNDVTWNWLPSKDGVKKDEAVGFNKKYTGTAFNLTGGVLALGSQCAHGNINVTSSDAITTSTGVGVLVNAYEAEAPNCGTPTGHDVGYTSGSGNLVTTIAGSSLKITNTFGNCYAVNFCDNFAPTFSGNGELLINPNVTNFKAGTKLLPATKTGPINIFSKKITSTGDFEYERTGVGNLHINLQVPQSGDCADCGFFYVNGNFKTTNTGRGVILIDSASTGQGHVVPLDAFVHIVGNYTHKGTSSSHTVLVSSNIQVDGNVDFKDASADKVNFISGRSWITFGDASADKFDYKGTTTGSLLVEAEGHDGCDPAYCNSPGAYVLFNATASTIQDAGDVKISSKAHYVKMDNGYAHTGTTGNLTVSGHSYVEVNNEFLGTPSFPLANLPASGAGATGFVEGLYIKRTGTGDDNILSDAGHIHVTNPFTYDGSSTGTLLVNAKGACGASACGALGGYILFESPVTVKHTSDGVTKIESSNHYVEMDKGYAYEGKNGNMTVDGMTAVDILGDYGATSTITLPTVLPNLGMYVHRDGDGEDYVRSLGGHVHVQFPFTYDQENNTDGTGLTVLASGSVCDNCYKGGYILMDSAVTTVNQGKGTTSFTSTNDYVKMTRGLAHYGEEGDLHITGKTAVDIIGKEYPAATANTALSVFTNAMPQAANGTTVEGLFIQRKDIGNDKIESPGGHVHVQFPLTYGQAAAASAAPFSGLTIDAEGNCGSNYMCNGGFTGGFVALDSAVTTWNTADGYVNIFAGNTTQNTDEYVRMQTGYVHHGVDGNLIVSGHNYVDIQGLYPTPAGSPLAGTPFSGLTLIETSYVKASTPDNTTNYGVYIDRKGDGMDSIVSRAGHVWVENPFTYIQASTNTNNTNGLRIWAMGADCDGNVCTADLPPYNPNGDRGYVWIGGDFWTENDAYGHTTVQSNNQSVIMDSTMYHYGKQGDLNILANTSGNECVDPCGDYDPEVKLKASGAGITDSRGYVWIGGPVNITQDATSDAGNAVIRSYTDIVEMDDSVMFTDAITAGANLWVEGKEGVRTLGPTHGFSNKFDPNSSTVDGSSSVDGATTPIYPTALGQGYVTYLSTDGFVDFGLMKGHTYNGKTDLNCPRTDEWYANAPAADPNYPFNYTGIKAENALLIEGNTRVFFGDSTTIKMNEAGPAGANNGDAKIYSPAGWIMFGDTVGYTGFAGNLNIYANGGGNVLSRSCMNPALTCYDRGGFVLFDSITNIEVKDKGVTWIRSNNDDVVMSDVFAYTNTANDVNNGEFIMQAGQDIYGRNVNSNGHNNDGSGDNTPDFNDSIKFVQHGDKSILLEAQKTIHLQQKLVFDREEAKTGDITLKAGYPTFAGDHYNGNATMTSQSADNNETTPLADLNKSDAAWAAGDCAPNNYVARFGCYNPSLINHVDGRSVDGRGSMEGGDIWLENNVLFDLSQSASSAGIPVTLRAFNSIFIDSTFTFTNVNGGLNTNNDILLFAEIGNVEAAVTRQNVYGSGLLNKLKDASSNGYIADDSVVFNLDPSYANELRIQAGNQVWGAGDENTAPTLLNTCWKKGCESEAEFDGNILFNKPLFVHNAGTDQSSTILSAARDLETQIMAPFKFDYTDVTNNAHGKLTLTAGRHIETHAMMTFDFPSDDETANITMQAGRLAKETMTGNSALCKANEAGTTLTDKDDAEKAFDPDVETGGVNGSKNNEFAELGNGNGSILMFDSVEFNYNGSGKILMTALNGNIESDPYLHRVQNEPANPGFGSFAGNAGAGYMPYVGYPHSTPSNPLQHDAQLTFNHNGTGVTRLEAIDIKLHDKIAYYDRVGTLTTTLLAGFGKLEINSYDSILTRNLEYVNHNGDQNLEITSDKYKLTATDCSSKTCPDNACYEDGNGAIQQGHIVLGYGADWITTDDDRNNMNDSIVINFAGNQFVAGANALIRAGYTGFSSNKVKGTSNHDLFVAGLDKGKAYGGNITFDYMKVDMAKGNHTAGGYMEISTPNGNIWGKDSINYRGVNGDLLVDAGLGSIEDLDAIRWSTGGNEAVGGVNNNGNYVPFENSSSCINGKENTLNTNVPGTCDSSMWRTGNIMMKGGSLNFNDSVNGNVAGTGNATFRTREGFIDTYDAFTVDSMQGDLLKYAGTLNNTTAATNEWGDISERDFEYHQVENSGSIFYGADDNIMMNYGYSNGDTKGGAAYQGRGEFDLETGKLADTRNPFYSTTYKPSIDAGHSIYNVNRNGYLWYRTEPAKTWMNGLHELYRGCTARTAAQTGVCSPITAECMTIGNYARDLMFNFDTTAVDGKTIKSGGLGVVAVNYIDMFTKFTYFGGQGSGMGQVPGMSTLHGESVSGYGLYVKSLFNGQRVENRRAVCEDCGKSKAFPMQGYESEAIPTFEWTYIGFHDDARIYTQDQKGLIEAPVIEFFGHAELNPYMAASGKVDPGAGNLTLKGDSLIFHDSAIFDGTNLVLMPYTTGRQRQVDMRYGVINDGGKSSDYYKYYGPAIQMPDRNTPILEFGYQRCNEPPKAPQSAPNERSKAGFESTPMVGGDVIISFQHSFSLPIYNTIVANNARISFVSDSLDDKDGGEFVDTYIRTDLLRIRNKVEFYTGQNEFGKYGNNPKNRKGKFRLSSTEYQETMEQEAGIFPRHLHMEPNSELSIPGEDTMKVYSTTTVGGYGNIHENISVVPNGTIAPGFASLMEYDCQTPHRQGQLTIHNLTMEKDAIFRISIGRNNPCYDEDGDIVAMNCTATDTLIVEDTIWFNGKIPLHILPETEVIDPGCYLFLEYGDSLGVSKEYVKNFTLPIDRFQDYYFGLDYSTPGKVYLCVMTFPQPIVQRYVKLPSVTGVTTTPNAGTHYISGHQDFSFTASFSGAPLKVSATGYYNGEYRDLDYTAVAQPDGSYLYTIYQVVQPWEVKIGPEASTVGNEAIDGQRVWAYKNTLHINVDKSDIVSIYNLTGVLYKKIEVPEGNSKFTLDRGMYVVTLKDGSVYKIVIK